MPPSRQRTSYDRLPQSPQDVPVVDNIQEGSYDSGAQIPVIQDAVALDERIRWIHFLLGAAVLLPWNALITATPYFLFRLSGSRLRSSFSSYMSITFTVANFLFLAHATISSKKTSLARRTFLSTISLVVLLALLALSTFISASPPIFFTFSLLNAAGQAAAGSYLQTSILATASLFGAGAMQAVMSGQAAVGVAISTVQLLSVLASSQVGHSLTPPEGYAEARSAMVFFTLSTLFLAVVLAAYIWMVRLPAYHSVVSTVKTHESDVALLDESTDESLGDTPEETNEVDLYPTTFKAESNATHLLRIARSNADFEIAVAYVFVVTLSVFPPITASILPSDERASALVFTTMHYLVFNIGDLFGRQLCSKPSLLLWDPRKLLTLSFARSLFVPAFLLCNIAKTSRSSLAEFPTLSSAGWPVGISDLYFFFLLLTFGITNGYVSSMCMIAAPSLAHNPRLRGREDVDASSTLAGFFLVGGLALGSAASFVVRAKICSCNPFVD